MNFQPSPLVICSLQGWLDLNRISVVDKLLATGGALSSSFVFCFFFKKRDNRSFALEEKKKKTSVGLGVSRLSSYGQTREADSSTSELFFFKNLINPLPIFYILLLCIIFFKFQLIPHLSLFDLFCFIFKKLLFIILYFLMFKEILLIYLLNLLQI